MRRAAKIDANQPEKVWQCQECGDERRWTVHQARHKYCSMNCVSASYKRRMKGDGNPNYKSAGERVCEHCGLKYQNYNKTRKYCSQKCYQANKAEAFRIVKEERTRQRKAAAAAKSLPIKQCARCGNDFKAKPRTQKFCSMECYRPPLFKNCARCGERFRTSPGGIHKSNKLWLSMESGGAQRAGEAASRAMRKYGVKKDANHKQIFGVFKKMATPVFDLSKLGCGVPDGIAWVGDDGGWQLFDVKNPETGYGKRGLNPRQREWAENWKGGPVYLIYSIDEAISFAKGELAGIARWPKNKGPQK